MSLISVIITSYNWPAALALSVHSLWAQTEQHFEIIIADDGSTPKACADIQALASQSPIPTKIVHHADLGFRAAMIRNKAAAVSQGDYLVFIDGDCVLRPNFIQTHRQLAEQQHFVPGNRVLLSPSFTQTVLSQGIALYQHHFLDFIGYWLTGKINRLSALLTLPLGPLRYSQPHKWQQAMTCNLGVWRSDFMRINGFDEAFAGWGFEDSDLVIRLIHAGVQRKEGRFAIPVLHLWHPSNDKSQQTINYQRLQQRLNQPNCILAEQGVSQYF